MSKTDTNAPAPQNRDDGVYVKLPVRAVKLLAQMNERVAQKILVTLCLYMDFHTRQSWPSYPEITKSAGVSKGSIRRSLTLLQDLGFISIQKRRKGGAWASNVYTVLHHSYHPEDWNFEKSAYLPYVARCLDCSQQIKMGGCMQSPGGRLVHLGCGGTAVFSKNRNLTKPPKPGLPPV